MLRTVKTKKHSLTLSTMSTLAKKLQHWLVQLVQQSLLEFLDFHSQQ